MNIYIYIYIYVYIDIHTGCILIYTQGRFFFSIRDNFGHLT